MIEAQKVSQYVLSKSKGQSYFVVDKDLSKGDRRCDGILTLTADFFRDGDGERVKKKRLLYEQAKGLNVECVGR